MKSRVIGQTGSKIKISDDLVQYKQSKKRTLRYQYAKVKFGWTAWVCGPFHSRTYGVCGFGTVKRTAKASLQDRLANNYGYLGNLIFSDVDDADNVLTIGLRVRSDYIVQPIPIGDVDV